MGGWVGGWDLLGASSGVFFFGREEATLPEEIGLFFEVGGWVGGWLVELVSLKLGGWVGGWSYLVGA